MDNHTTHSTLQIYDFCKANGIVLLTIPPHTSHKLQPLDVTFYKSLKTGFNEECNKYLKCHPHQKITPFEVAELFNKAFMRVATPQKAVNGFEHTGIFPYNPDVFSPEDFTPAQIYKSHEPDIREAEESAEIIRHSSPELTLMGESIRHSTPEPTSSLVPGTSEHLSFTEMLPTPVAKNLGTRKNSKAVHSEIITSTPNKQNLILKEDRRLKKLERSKNKEKKLSSVKKQVFPTRNPNSQPNKQVQKCRMWIYALCVENLEKMGNCGYAALYVENGHTKRAPIKPKPTHNTFAITVANLLQAALKSG
ncbi:hypothetical protein Zmor_014578 [Zophobas morio]|uniref:DDE-1 domain-containing protein n=1 Tax=Zophobas morio TaxID=2755281 RepID=A0AA38MG97_9CUCU|nr:hypothetical protein Zmor_014578 [Zophobas morio]